MSMKRSFLARIGPRAHVQAIDRTASGSPARLRLRPLGPGPMNTPKAALALARRHLSLRKAHLALTRLAERGEVVLEAPVVEDRDALLRELAEAGIAATAHEPPARLNVKAIRESLAVSQEEFALRFGLDADTVRNWEQGRSQPDRAARTVLWLIANDPEAVSASLDRAGEPERVRRFADPG